MFEEKQSPGVYKYYCLIQIICSSVAVSLRYRVDSKA